jgi:hypothetical protein
VITKASTLTDVAFHVCTALEGASVTAVLTGGSAATFYAPDAYQSRDIDFVITVWAPNAERALLDAGFTRDIDCYVHPDTVFPIEFPQGPLMVGDDHIRTWNTVRRDSEVLNVLTPTDSCRDRLAAFLFWNDFSGLEQALSVCRARSDVDLDAVRSWCRRTGHLKKWQLLKARLDAAT